MGNRELASRTSPSRFLDIGTVAGRHAKLAGELGFIPYGIDTSLIEARFANQSGMKVDGVEARNIQQ